MLIDPNTGVVRTDRQQDLDENVKLGKPYFAEPGLIVLPEVTVEAIQAAVHSLWEQGYFHKATFNACQGTESCPNYGLRGPYRKQSASI